ncbi:MAG: DUF4097 family beta strand repeat-containing protein [Planctomycetota bacterium]
MIRTTLAFLALLVLSACTPGPQGRLPSDALAYSRLGELRIDSQGPLRLDVSFPIANISITQRIGVDEIAIDFQSNAASRDLLDDIGLDARWRADGTLHVRARGPEGSGSRRWAITRVDLLVPNTQHVSVSTETGRVLISGIGPDGAGDFISMRPHRVVTSSGPITLTDMNGAITAQTSAGNITIEGGTGDLVVSSAAGDIDVQRHTGLINARSTSGDLSIEDATAPFTLKTHSGDINAAVGRRFAGRVFTDTASGRVENPLKAESPADAASSATTMSGDITIVPSG